MSAVLCPGLNNISYDNVNLPVVRISMFVNCKRMSTLVLNSMLNAIQRPYSLSFHNGNRGKTPSQWSGVYGDLIHNRTDICVDYQSINYDKYQMLYNSPILVYSNVISILSGIIYDNSRNSINVFDSFPLKMWIIFGLLLLLVAIISEVVHTKSFFRLSSLVIITDNYFALIMQFLSQGQKCFTRICCIKHYIMNSMVLLSITLITFFFNSKVSSDLIHNPLLRIDSIDDLVHFISQHTNIKVITDKSSTSWPLLDNWQGNKFETIKKIIENVPINKFNYEEVYNGKFILIGHDNIFQRIMNVNPELKFHISSDRHYGSQVGLFYSKSIDKELRDKVDFVCRALFESGLQNSYIEARQRSPRIKVNGYGYGHLQENISIEFIGKRIQFFVLSFTTLVLILIMQILWKYLYAR